MGFDLPLVWRNESIATESSSATTLGDASVYASYRRPVVAGVFAGARVRYKAATGNCGTAALASPGTIGKKAAQTLGVADDRLLQHAEWK